jgi:ribose 5-phosphate isomerase A
LDQNLVEQAKKAAAMLAVKETVKNNMVIGVGSGSTIIYAVRELASLVSKNGWQIVCIPTSYQAKGLIFDHKLPLGSLDQYPVLDVAIDGADEITSELNVIKGGGGCLVQEKIVGINAKNLIIIADWRKVSTHLGKNWTQGVPVEIIPEAQLPLILKFEKMGGKAALRQGISKIGPLVTDNGNFILDVDFGKINNPEKLSSQIKSLTGVIDSGLFINMVKKAYIGQKDGRVEIITKE